MKVWATFAFLIAAGIIFSGCCSVCSFTAPTPCRTDSDCAGLDCKASTPYAACLGASENGTGVCGCSSSPPSQPTPISTGTPHQTPTPSGTSTPAPSQTPNLGCPSYGGAITACPCTISTSGNYTLSRDLTSSGTCITIASGGSGSTLDCQGHSLTGPSDSDSLGILLNGSSGVTVKGCVLKHFNCGIHLIGSSDNTITGNTATLNRQCGVGLDSSIRNTVSGNTLSSNTYDGIFILHNSNGNTFTGNTCNANMIGAYIHWDSGGSNNRFTNNTATGSTGSNGDFHCEYSGAQVDGGGNRCGAAPRCSWLACH